MQYDWNAILSVNNFFSISKRTKNIEINLFNYIYRIFVITIVYRFNPQLSEDIAMDEKNDIKLIKMLFEAKAYMHKNRSKVIEMINLIK